MTKVSSRKGLISRALSCKELLQIYAGQKNCYILVTRSLSKHELSNILGEQCLNQSWIVSAESCS